MYVKLLLPNLQNLEQIVRIELTSSVWKTDILPLNYICSILLYNILYITICYINKMLYLIFPLKDLIIAENIFINMITHKN